MTQVISIGPPFTMVQNTIYAMPARMVWCVVSNATAVLQFANDPATTSFVTVAASTTGFQSSWGFVRNTNSTVATISLKA